jgi:LmbE family N-acetylglucosaminyl deacetylase
MRLQLERPDEIVRPYAHVCLSPHLDDAALSCGGLLAGLAAAGAPVLVVNVCGGSPPRGGPFSPFAALQHERWGLPADQAVALRRAEDAAALAALGVDGLDLGLLDAIYRMPAAYVDDQTLFGAVAPDDTLAAAVAPALAALAARLSGATFYAPLGVGNHVDHQAVHAVAAKLAGRGADVRFYEDFPYVAQAGALARRLDQLGGPGAWAPAAAAIDGALELKIAAVGAYASQLGTLFGGAEPMARAVAGYARRVAPPGAQYGERVWVTKGVRA